MTLAEKSPLEYYTWLKSADDPGMDLEMEHFADLEERVTTAGGWTAADIDEQEYRKFKSDSLIAVARVWLDIACDFKKTDENYPYCIIHARETIDFAGGLEAAGVTPERWLEVTGEPYAAVAKDALGKPDATGEKAEAN